MCTATTAKMSVTSYTCMARSGILFEVTPDPHNNEEGMGEENNRAKQIWERARERRK